MERRPYLALDVSRLSKLVNGNAQDKSLLETVLFELKFRKTGAAKQLKRRVEQLLDSPSDGENASIGMPQSQAGLPQKDEIRTKQPRKIKESSGAMSKEQDPQAANSFLNSADPFVLESLELMRKKLLDLTARNRLLNFPIQQKGSALRIIDEVPNQLCEELLADHELKFRPVPPPTRDQLIEHGYLEVDEETGEERQLRPNPDAREWAKVLGFDVHYDLPREEDAPGDEKHQDDAIQVLLYPPEVESRLRAIRSKAQTAIEEMGASILYLSLGFLEWTEKDDSSKNRLAPLFTIPVHLNRGKLDHSSGTYQYTLSYTGEDILPNLSLKEKLALDFGLALPDVTEEVSPEDYLELVGKLIKTTKPNWSVRRYGALALLNFGKMLMYLDLDPERWPLDDRNLIEHPIVKRFFTSSADSSGDGGGNAGEHYIDEVKQIHDLFPLIDDADSSQHSALIDAVNGENLVIEGPPGTGKSQTITNLIAAAMLRGKRVLFVAEKMAALDVVRSRLDKAGLGDFCLELHSHKSQKRKVLDDINTRVVKQKHLAATQSIDAEIVRYEELKERLNSYAQEINEPWANTNRTIHEIFCGAARYRQKLEISPTDIHIVGLSGSELTEVNRLKLVDQVSEFQKIYRAMIEQVGPDANLHDHPWSGVENTAIQLFDSEQIVSDLHHWQQSLERLQEHNQKIAETLSFDESNLSTLESCESLALDLSDLPELSRKELFQALGRLDQQTRSEVESLLRLHREIQESYERLSEVIRPEKLSALAEGESLPPFPDLHRLTGANHGESFSNIVRGILKLQKIETSLVPLDSQMEELKSALPSPLSEHFGCTIEGLGAAIKMIELAGALDNTLINVRSDHFDEDDLDATLEDLKARVHHLRPLRDKTAECFDLEKLPDSGELEAIQAQVQREGMGKWFSGDWWQARKKLKALAARPDLKVKEISAAIQEAIEYVSGMEDFDSTRYQHQIGCAFDGLETDIEALKRLREWYQSVRNAYGIGFGQTVAIGDSILALDSKLFKGIQQLEKKGFTGELRNILTAVEEVQAVIPNIQQELGRNRNLIGDQGSLLSEHRRLKTAGAMIQQWIKDSELSVEAIKDCIDQLRKLQQEQSKFTDNNLLQQLFAPQAEVSIGPNADNKEALEAIRETLDFASYVQRKLRFEPLRQVILSIKTHDEYELLKSKAGEYLAAWEDQEETYELFKSKTELNPDHWLVSPGWNIEELRQRNLLAIQKPEWLNDWINFVRIRNEMQAQGLEPLWRMVTSGKLDIKSAGEALDLAIFDQLSREILAERPHLARISGKNQEALQSTFRQYDQKLKALQRQRIASALAERHIPQGNSGGRKSEYTDMALINNELGKKTRHIPIRQLINRASNALLALKPCFMMGPMSAAHYLKPGHLQFDLVVMDEASQVKPEDALGVIARGAQLVVVGDPKQLPPTSFFDRQDMNDDDDDSAAVAQTDSILDASLPLFKMRRLRWHYRSQHESLIAFSNRNFYDNDLVIFPSPHAKAQEYGVKFSYVKGGRFVNQYNVEEARVVAKAAVKHALNHPNESLGIVAMSSKQREQIERAVEEECKADDAVAEAIEGLRNLEDGLFIKNLENVQGDERDVIFISCTYGPSEIGGRVYQRFGPINSDVGWRRLNVLFTRSKKRMHIFSSMRSDDILISESSKRGVIALRNFLDYAEKGSMDGTPLHTGKAPDSDFEVAVIEALHQAGFESEAQVGVAGFFIDIAVKDPGKPGRYLMGIECDGATYHSAKSARDRDRLRQEVLERLGWRVRRIWSTDWFSNPKGELEPIIRELHELKSDVPVAEESFELDVDPVEEIDPFYEAAIDEVSEVLDSESGLKERLEVFGATIIHKQFPDTPKERRLLRPAMIEALVEHEPVSSSEFVELIPEYLRKSTEPQEARAFLSQVLEIVAGSEINLGEQLE
ncbi:MAG: DUF4011 domain-containing anti-phage protein Hhe [Pseudomonadota bacterium]|nr:DUF4011 domain-containing anti-phage protein Hhe [Pseudomonadota bacterium]